MHLLLALALNLAAPEAHLVPPLRLASVAPAKEAVLAAERQRALRILVESGSVLALNAVVVPTLLLTELTGVTYAWVADLLLGHTTGGGPAILAGATAVGSLVVDAAYLFAAPLVCSLGTMLVARLMGDAGGSLAQALLASFPMGLVGAASFWAGSSLLLATLYSAPGLGPIAGLMLMGFGAGLGLVGAPVAAAVAFHWGEVPAPAAPPEPRVAPPPAPPSYTPLPALDVPLVRARF